MHPFVKTTASVALAAFLSQVALTEARELQAAVAGALLRAAAAFLVAAHVVASVGRESNDKGLELALALPISRSAWYLGKLAGTGRLPTLRRLIDNQQDFISAFAEIVRRPQEQEEVLRDLAVRCLAG